MLMGLLSSIFNTYNRHSNWISLSNPRCMIPIILIKLHSNEYSQEFHYYPFSVKLDRCVGSCNILNDLSFQKTEYLNLIMLTWLQG